MVETNHLTTEPSNVPTKTKRTRLVRDLNALECVSNVEVGETATNAVLFECGGTVSGDIPVDVLRVLVEHDAFLPNEQPKERGEVWTLINVA